MRLKGKKILTIVSADFDDLELYYPIIRLREEGATVVVAAEKKQTSYKGKYGLSIQSDIAFDTVDIKTFDGMLIPGGWAPDYLRRLPSVLGFVTYLHQQKKVIGHICHAGWILASAGILKGVNVTSTPGIKDDLVHAGAIWHDVEALRDDNIISARRPPDLPFYLPLLIEALSE